MFHYGSIEEQLPYSFGPRESLNFPVRCVQDSLNGLQLASQTSALDIGCAIGRASFELARYFQHVTAIDNSKQFIKIAKQLQQQREFLYQIPQEGKRYSRHVANVPNGIEVDRVNFHFGDATVLFKEEETFDFVLAANIICRLKDPRGFLESIPQIVSQKGILAVASPYSWLEEFTPPHKWLGSENTSAFEEIQEILAPHFTLLRTFDLPFLIREHARKYQWGISQMSLWKRM